MTKDKEKMYIGVDVSKDTLDIYWKGKSFKIKNDEPFISAFIKAEITSRAKPLCVLEKTGGYERVLIKALVDHKIPFHAAHPNKVKAFGNVCGHFAKTDKQDAILLFKYGVFISDEQKGDPILDDLSEEVTALRRLSRTIGKTLHGLKCRIKQMPSNCTRVLQKHIDFHEAELKALESLISEKIASHSELGEKQRLMMTMYGIGQKNSSTLLSEVPELGTLTKKQVAGLLGVAPRTHQSGKKSLGGHICGGRFYGRQALYQAALTAVRWGPKFKAKYERLKTKGKAKKVALVAIMRDMIIILNAMIKKGRTYELST
jgi:transposase